MEQRWELLIDDRCADQQIVGAVVHELEDRGGVGLLSGVRDTRDVSGECRGVVADHVLADDERDDLPNGSVS